MYVFGTIAVFYVIIPRNEQVVKQFIFSEMYYCEYYKLIMASLHHFKRSLLFLENYCGLSVIIYWYLKEPTLPLVDKIFSLGVSVVVW